MTIHTTQRRLARLLALLLATALAVAACSGGDFDDASSGVADLMSEEDTAATSDDDAGDDMIDSEAMAEEADTVDGDTGSLAEPTGLTAADLGRDIIFRAEIAVEVDDVAAAGREATQRIESLGGVVFGQTTAIEPSPRTVLTFKVAPDDFDDALEALGGVGELVDQTITADDVTDRVVDLESRVATAATSVDRLREFLSTATTVEDVAQLERELVSRETDLETLRGQLRTLQDQVALATITVTITERGIDVADAALDLITGLGVSVEDACPGAQELETERDDAIVWCVEIENVGDATLIDLELTSNTLGLRTRDFEVVDGDLTTLEAGGVVRAVVELDIDDGRIRRRNAVGGLHVDVRVDATPADDVERTLQVERGAIVFADDTEPLPGFTDAFGRGVGVLAYTGSLLLVLVGGLLPFVPVVAVIALFVRFIRRRTASVPTIEE